MLDSLRHDLTQVVQDKSGNYGGEELARDRHYEIESTCDFLIYKVDLAGLRAPLVLTFKHQPHSVMFADNLKFSPCLAYFPKSLRAEFAYAKKL